MKKAFFILVCCILSVQFSFADKKIYTTDTLQLPVAARQFINTHFSGVGISHIKIEKEFWEGNQYDVILTNGFDLDFDKNGEWKEIDGHRNALPVTVIPEKMAVYLNKNFPGFSVISIEKGREGYEVKLSDGRELKFNREQLFIGYED